MIFGGNATLAGTLTLQGAAVPPPANALATPIGDTFSGNDTGGSFNFNGQITGPGTLEFIGAHTYELFLNNTNTVNTNNWQGGMIIGGHSGTAANVDIAMKATNQIPSGPGTGEITFLPATTAVYARFDLNGFNTTVNGLIGTASSSATEAQIANFGSANCTLTLGAANTTAIFNGTVSDSGNGKALSLNKIGTGTQTFGGTMTYFGNTTVSAGNLTFTGTVSPNSTNITVASNATLNCGSGLTIGAGHTLNCVGTIVGNTAISGTVETLDAIGTLTDNGSMTLNGGATYVWDVNNFTGTAGGDPGWSLLNVTGGTLTISASPSSQINLDITSLTSGDVAGNAANYNSRVNGSWVIASATGGVSGYTGPTQFNVVTAAFGNSPSSSAKWSVGVTNNNLMLYYNSVSVIFTPLVDQTNNAGTTATFTVTANANGLTPPIFYNWLEGSTPVTSGSTAAGGGTITITTNNVANTSTLTIANVQDADAGAITVNVSDNFGDSGSSVATLTVIDPPTGPMITQTNGTGIAAGGVVGLIASAASGTQPFTYTWFLNGVALTNGGAFSGATSAILEVDLGTAQTGNYTVVISNPAGSVTNSLFPLGPVTTVPGQAIYEPFTSYVAQPPGGNASYDTWEGVTNLYNQLTGGPAWWFHSSGSGIQMVVSMMDMYNGTVNRSGGTYPWPGLAGNSTNMLYWTTSLNSHLEFAQTESFPTNTKLYCSFLLALDQGAALTVGMNDVLAGFTTSDTGTAFNLKVCTTNINGGQCLLGIAKANGVGSTQSVDANTLWESNPTDLGQVVLVVVCYTVNSGGNVATDDAVSMWVNPSASAFYASEANVPTPDLGPTSFGVANSMIRDFAVHAVNQPASHRIADLRIGTTWASVTPPSAPTLSLGNVYAPRGTTAVLASQNAGNPAASYGWQFNGGAALSDGSTGHGSSISGSATGTLTISNIQTADYGIYTVNATNTDPSPLDSPTNLVGSTSAIVSGQPPSLHVVYSRPGNVIVSWPTNWIGYLLEQSPAVGPSNAIAWTTNSLPPYPVSGTNNAVTVPVSGTEFFQLINP